MSTNVSMLQAVMMLHRQGMRAPAGHRRGKIPRRKHAFFDTTPYEVGKQKKSGVCF
jgi:hypothetical protein